MTEETSHAGDTLRDFSTGPVADAAKTIDRTFAKAFGAMERTITKAALSGKTSIKSMVDAIVSDLDRIAVRQFIAKPLAGALASLAKAILPVTGTRAGGGPVSAGNAYLVGERGPELFVPGSSGMVAADATAARPQVVLNVQANDAASFRKSEGQIAAMMIRALRRGQRNV